MPQLSFAQETIFSRAHCTIVYSLHRSADQYFNDEIVQLSKQISKKNIQFIDLNHWRKTTPHIQVSGRVRNLLRQKFELIENINRAIITNSQGQVIGRYSGSVTLVNALLDCD